MLRQTHCHVCFTRLGISSSNNKLYRFDMSTNVRGGNLMWARMSGVVIWCEHECPGWSFDVCTNVRPCQKSRGNECPWERMSVHRLNLIPWARPVTWCGVVLTFFICCRLGTVNDFHWDSEFKPVVSYSKPHTFSTSLGEEKEINNAFNLSNQAT